MYMKDVKVSTSHNRQHSIRIAQNQLAKSYPFRPADTKRCLCTHSYSYKRMLGGAHRVGMPILSSAPTTSTSSHLDSVVSELAVSAAAVAAAFFV